MSTLTETYWWLWVKNLTVVHTGKKIIFITTLNLANQNASTLLNEAIKMWRLMDQASKANNPLILAATYTYIHACDGHCGMHNNRLNHVWRFQQLLFLTQSFLSSRLSPENLCFFLLALGSLLPFHPLWRPFCPWPHQLLTPLCACCLLEMWQTLVTKEVSCSCSSK